MKIILLICLPFIFSVAGKNVTGYQSQTSNGDKLKNINSKIIGGSSADLGDFPYQCFLQIETSQTVIQCGCSIVATNWVVTSTGCADNASPSDMLVAVGFVSVKELQEGLNGKLVNVVRKVEYPGFNNVGRPPKNDITLLKLESELDFDEYVDKLNIPTSDISVGSAAVVSGYGYFIEGVRPSEKILRSANVDVYSNTQCESWLRGYDQKFSRLSKHLCAGKSSSGSAVACSGDGGGPLTKSVNGKTYLYGIFSFIYSCSESQLPGVYTRVSEYADWINRNIDDVKECSSSSECANDASCINYTCVCYKDGYKGDGIMKCEKNGGTLNSGSKAILLANFLFYCFA